MEQESGIEQPPAYEAGENFFRTKSAEYEAMLVAAIDPNQLPDLEAILNRLSEG